MHKLIAAEDHVFVELNEGRFLVDTGSPLSFGDVSVATFAGQRHQLPSSLMGIDVASLRKLFQGPCSGLLGLDVLGTTNLLFDLRDGELHTGPNAWDSVPQSDRIACDVRAVAGLPVVRVSICNQPVAAAWDTGAKFGYVADASICEGATSMGEIDDYNPVLGRMHSDSWLVDVDLAPNRAASQTSPSVIRERVGILPPMGSQMLAMAGIEAIIGCSWMPDWYIGLEKNSRSMWIARKR